MADSRAPFGGYRFEVRGLACARGDRTLFADAAFRLDPGDALYVTGSNGAGKTSLLRLLAGLAQPEYGEILWCGESIRCLREEFSRNLLYLGHAAALKDELSALENLDTTATLAGEALQPGDARAALRAFGLKGREHLPARVLSQGQRRRVNLARLLLPQAPALWILDEPFNALDVRAVEQLRETIDGHLGRGGMVIYTTHQPVAFAHAQRRQLALTRGTATLC